MSLYTMKLSDSVDTMEFNLLEVPIQDKDIEGAVDNVVLSGDIYTDFLWLKKRFTHKWSILCKDDYERLRGFYTRQFSNAEVPIYQLLDAPSPIEESAGSGEYIQITTTDSTAKLASVEMQGNAEQTTYSGKNLVPNTLTTGTTNGLTYTVQSDGTIKLTGRATARVEPYLYNNSNAPLTFPAGTYKNTSSYPIILYAGGYNLFPAGGSLTFSETKSVAQAYFRVEYTGTTLNETYYPQIIASTTTNEDYEPYVGGTASPNPSYPQPISVVAGENVVKIEGKNLYSDTWENGGISASSGANNSDANIRTVNYVPVLASTTYTASCGTGTRIALRFYNSAGTYLSAGATSSTNTNTFTTPANTARVRFVVIGASGTTPNFQLELGSTATAYEPYQGQEFEVNLGKNLIYTGDRTNQGITFAYNATTGETSVSGTASTTYANALQISEYLPAGTYTLSIQDTLPFTVGIGTRNSANTRTPHGITAGNKTLTFTLTEPAFSFDVYLTALTSGSQINSTFKLQCEKGSSASSFAPYFTPIELAKIGNYQDRIYKEDSKWYIEKKVGKVVLDGTESGWTWADTARYTITTANIGAREAISDHFTYVNYTGHASTASPSFDISSNLASIGFHDKDITSLNNFKTWLASNPTIVYYALATPTTTEITNEALIAQLEALGASSLYLGLNNIGTETPNAMPTLALTYFPYYPHEIVSPKAVRMELTDGGIINACECRENVQITLRETIQ